MLSGILQFDLQFRKCALLHDLHLDSTTMDVNGGRRNPISVQLLLFNTTTNTRTNKSF